MAKKRKAAKRTTRRRMSGAGSQGLNKILGAVVGYVGGKMLSQKLLPTMDDKIKGVALVAVGQFGVPMIGKSPMFEGLGMGVTIAGADTALRGFNVISGAGNVNPQMFLPSMSGDGISRLTVAGADGISQTTVAGSRRRYRVDG